MENHVIAQMNNDEKLEDKKDLIGSVVDLYNNYLNTLNNEEKYYMNMEDVRVGLENKYLFTSEIGIFYGDDVLMRTGACDREVYFKITGAIPDVARTAIDVETVERNDLIKEQWLKKFLLARILLTPENVEVEKELRGFNYRGSEDGFIKDVRNDKIYTLLIKPVNDSAFSVRDQIWPNKHHLKPVPMSLHLAEAAMLLYFYKMPVKILYVGKNNSEMYREFNIGVKDGCLLIDEEKDEKFNLTYLFNSMETMRLALTQNIIPPRSYMRERTLNSDEINTLKQNMFINESEYKALFNGKPYKSFKCNSCKYENLCNSLHDEWVSNE